MAAGLLQRLQNAVVNALQYPQNLLYPKALDNNLIALREQLNYRAKKLFCAESNTAADSKASLDVWELYREDEGFRKTQIKEAASLEWLLQVPIAQNRPDPRQRMFFIHAPHSRAQLSINQKMFLQILTYHNVMPTFLEYVFPFGKQHFARDFHLMGFRSESQLSDPIRGLSIPELGRSGRHIELCYSLKSVERSSDLPLRRSIRQCSVHHMLDLVNEQSTWIFIKANDVISNAVQEHAKDTLATRTTTVDREPSPLASSLGVHLILAGWAGSNWHWYISELESYLQCVSRQALSASWELPGQLSNVPAPEKAEPKPSTPPQRSFTLKSLQRSPTQKHDSPPLPKRSSTMASEMGFLAPQTTGFDDFSFRDLQNVQFVEEKANEVLLVLKSNSNVLRELINEYRAVSEAPSCASHMPNDFAYAVARFCQKLESIEKDMSLQLARVQTLLSFTADRKSLLNAVFQYRSMQASRLYAEKAQLSADNMEEMTEQMSVIAKKTEAETVSMRIITWVTLFFLPGTFMAALFSTPIINFHPDGPTLSLSNIGFGALKLYAIASIPLVFLTLFAWFAMDFKEKRQEKKKTEKALKEKAEMV